MSSHWRQIGRISFNPYVPFALKQEGGGLHFEVMVMAISTWTSLRNERELWLAPLRLSVYAHWSTMEVDRNHYWILPRLHTTLNLDPLHRHDRQFQQARAPLQFGSNQTKHEKIMGTIGQPCNSVDTGAAPFRVVDSTLLGLLPELTSDTAQENCVS